MSTLPCSFCGAVDHVLAQCAGFLDAARCYERGDLAESDNALTYGMLVEAAYPVSSEFLVEPGTPGPLTDRPGSGQARARASSVAANRERHRDRLALLERVRRPADRHPSRVPEASRAHEHLVDSQSSEERDLRAARPRAPCSGARTCGIYAIKDSRGFRTPITATFVKPIAYGRVSLWGRIVEHKHGYRAQFAYPLDLVLAGGRPSIGRPAEAPPTGSTCGSPASLSQPS